MLVLLACALLVSGGSAFPGGAGEDACASAGLYPEHGVNAQSNDNPPYGLIVGSGQYSANGRITGECLDPVETVCEPDIRGVINIAL